MWAGAPELTDVVGQHLDTTHEGMEVSVCVSPLQQSVSGPAVNHSHTPLCKAAYMKHTMVFIMF